MPTTSTQPSSPDQDPGAFRDLTAPELTEIAAFGVERSIAPGEMLFEAGEASYDLFVVLDGRVEVVNGTGPDAVVIVAYGRGGFVGELNLLTGQRRSLGCRVTQAGRVLVVSEEQFRRLLCAPGMRDPEVIIRTGGEQRLSNYLLWQSAYSELIFRDELWPDFSRDALRESLAEFSQRRRRFGAR